MKMPLSLEDSLNRIIQERSLTVLFQPIVSNKLRAIYGYEALIRGPSNTPLHSPVTLFETAASCGRLVELEMLCREVAIKQFLRLNLPEKLFLNTSPESLAQPGYPTGCTLDIAEQAGLKPERVVIELTEQYPTQNYDVIRDAKNHFKEMGFEIAIDDLGAGYAGLRMWSELQPDYVKIDRHFMQDIHEDTVKQEFVRSILNIARGLNCRVIGEGVETIEEYRCVTKLGINYIQGYYFARPTNIPIVRIPKNSFAYLAPDEKKPFGRSYFSKTIADLLQRTPGIPSSTTVDECAQIFHMAPQLDSLPIVDGDMPIGLARKNTLTSLLLTRFGRELHGKKAISRFIENEALMLESNLPIEEASRRVSEQMKQDKALDFIILENGCYKGMGSATDLLTVITEMQVRSARYANPLTLLPGNVPIYEEVDYLLREKQEFVVCYCDLDSFKPFNDKYGYEKGDQVIKDLAEILKANVPEEHDFVGHIGGDDFILILLSEDWRDRCKNILAHFKKNVARYYTREDINQGGIWSQDRSGKYRFFPLLTLSIGCAIPDPYRCKSHHDIAALATGAKHEAKRISGNSLFVERRRVPLKSFDKNEAVA